MPASLAPYLIATSAGIILALGCLHVLLTFRGPKLLPRDRELMAHMEAVSPVITRETSMWKAWVGFNASHGFGAMLYGSVYGYLALIHGAFLLRSGFLLAVGALLLGGYVFLGWRYWFSVPFRGIVLAALIYAAALALVVAA